MASNNDSTPNRGKGRPKGTKKKGFKGTPKKINFAIEEPTSTVAINNVERNCPIGLTNSTNVCFFNSVSQVLFSLEGFKNHVNNFIVQNLDEKSALDSIKSLFRKMEDKTSVNPVRTHEYVQSLQMPGYVENNQFDAQECMSCITNMFYPRVNDKSDPKHNMLPDNCLFGISGEESIVCFGCNQHFNKPYRTALCT